MKYKITLSVIFVFTAVMPILYEFNYLYVAWPLSSLALVFFAYLGNSPAYLMGKSKRNLALIIINLPWLLFTWSVFVATYVLSKEKPYHKVPGHNIFYGCYPLKLPLEKIDLIIDLTAEFPVRNHKITKFIPNLDGIELSNIEDVDLKNRTVFVHCAQGHGRTATWLSIQLTKNQIFSTSDEALIALQSERPTAKPSKDQLKQIRANQSLKGIA